MSAHERLVIDEDAYGRLTVAREPAPDLVFAGTRPERGVWEDAHRDAHANDNGVEAEYLPPSA